MKKFAENWLYLPMVAVAVCVFLYWATISDREPPLIAYDGRVEPLFVKAGENFVVIWQVRGMREDRCEVGSQRNEIVDFQGTGWQIDSFQDGSQTSATGPVIARLKTVPFAAAWGKAIYRRTSCYECSGITLTRIWPICRTWPDVPFEIIPPH